MDARIPNMDTILLSELKILRWSAGGGCLWEALEKWVAGECSRGVPFNTQTWVDRWGWFMSVKTPNCHLWVERSDFLHLGVTDARTSIGRYQEMKGMFGTGLGAFWVPSSWVPGLVRSGCDGRSREIETGWLCRTPGVLP